MADLGYFGLQINVAILLIFNIVILKKHGFQNKLKLPFPAIKLLHYYLKFAGI